MKTTFTLVLALAVVLIGLQAPAAATGHPANYLVLKGGLYAPSQDPDIETVHFTQKDGFVAEIAGGRYFGPFFATEFGVGYFQSKGSPAVEAGESKFQCVPVTLTGKVLLPLGPFVEPYAELGIGAYITKAEASGTNIKNFDASTKGVVGLHAGAGVNFNITPLVFLGAEGKYLWAKPSFGGQDINLDGFTVTADLGFRF